MVQSCFLTSEKCQYLVTLLQLLGVLVNEVSFFFFKQETFLMFKVALEAIVASGVKR